MRTVKRHVKDKLPVVRLTEKELVRLMKATFATPRLEQVRDLFIFSCFTGLHYQNLKEIRKQHLRTKYGLQWVVMERALTEAPIHIPLLAIPQMILEKYKLRFKETEHILPVPSNQRLNVYLKEIGEMCDIRKNMTMYLAIHTFKETIAAGNGLSSGAVCKMLGRFDLRNRHAYVTDSIIKREMGKISENCLSLEKIAAKYIAANK